MEELLSERAMLTPPGGKFLAGMTVSLKWGGCGYFRGGTDTVIIVIDVTLPHTPLPMCGKGYSGLRCVPFERVGLTGTVGGILRLFIQAGLVAHGPRGVASRRGFLSALASAC